MDLDLVRQQSGDINKIRFLMKGDFPRCLNLFQQAINERDYVSQIELAYCYYGMKWGKDDKKQYTNVSQMEKYDYYPHEYLLYRGINDEINKLNYDDSQRMAKEAYMNAYKLGYLPAVLEYLYFQWRLNTSNYGFAMQLLPYIGKGDNNIDYYFGRALKHGCEPGTELYYQGMYWMEKSLGIEVKFPLCGEKFGQFTDFNMRHGNMGHSYHELDCLLHIGDTILAPSPDYWNDFKESKILNINVKPIESYSLPFNINEVKS